MSFGGKFAAIHPKPWHVTTYFFSHFPSTFYERDMWRIFSIRGRVQEVFISKKVNRLGHRFDFVRFCDVKNTMQLPYGYMHGYDIDK